ncbi:MAG: HepT-like ribonuclease domain-containing protein [Candidatus Bathyarchaeales archaeon]
MMLSEGILDEIRRIVRGIEGLEFVALFGSLVERGESIHDVDVAVKASGKGKYSAFCKVVGGLSEGLNVREEQVDIVDLDRADLEVKKEVVVKGIVLLDRTGYRRRLIEEVNAKYAEYDELQKISVNEWIESDDPSSVNLNIVKRRIDFAKAEVQFLKENVLCKGIVEVENSPVLQRLMERSYHLSLEAILDVCRHITSSMGWGPALSYSDFIDLCFEHKVIDEWLKENVVRDVRLRNIIIHRYLEVDYRKLYEESAKLEGIVKEFEKQVLSFIRKLR